MTWEELVAGLNDQPDGFLCPACLEALESREEKWRHMKAEHGYELIDLGLDS